MLAVLAIGIVVQTRPCSARSSTGPPRCRRSTPSAPRWHSARHRSGRSAADHHLLPLGTPIALITIPSLGLRAVVLEGTTARCSWPGPGHVRTTVFPGGAGTSVVLGRAAAYGGPFGRIAELRRGQLITVATQVGTSRFRVVRVRPAGAMVLATGAGHGPTHARHGPGSRYLAVRRGVGRRRQGRRPARLGGPADHPRSFPPRAPLAADTSTLWALLLWLEALGVLLVGAVWTWRRWGRAQAWIVFAAPDARGLGVHRRPGRPPAAQPDLMPTSGPTVTPTTTRTRTTTHAARRHRHRHRTAPAVGDQSRRARGPGHLRVVRRPPGPRPGVADHGGPAR